MKIALIGQKGAPTRNGGVERYAENLAAHLASAGHEVFLYSRKYYSQGLKEYRGFKIISVPSINTRSLEAITNTFFAIVDVIFRKVDVINLQSIGPASLIWLLKIFKPGTPITFTFHCQDYYHAKWGRLARAWLHIGEYLGCHLANEVIVISRDLVQYVEKKYGFTPTYIPLGTDVMTKVPVKNITRWGLEQGNYIVFVGRLVRHKGVHHLINAFKKTDTTKKLVIVGDGEYLSALEKLAAGDERIIFTGNQGGRVLDQLYANAYLFVQSSEMEGLSTSLLEAMAHRTACLTSDIIANRETLAGTGFTFVSKNITDLQTQLQKLISSPLDVESKAGLAYERIQREYTWSEIAKKILEVYKKLLVKAIVN